MSTRRITLGLLAVLLLPWGIGSASGQGEPSGKRAFEIADYYRTTFVGGPHASSDGGLVAFSVSHRDLENVRSWSEIWMMAADATALRQMTFGHHHDGSVSFTPDGRSLLFVSDRDGTSQLYLMPIDGGEPRQLTHFEPGLSDPRVSPDGRWIAATADVFPECGADGACNAKLRKGIEDGKLQVHVAEGLLYRHWTRWRDGTYAHVILVDARSGEVVRDLTPGAWDSPTFSLGGDRGYDFSPDSKELVYVSNHDPHPESSTNADLWIVPIGEGDVGPGSASGSSDDSAPPGGATSAGGATVPSSAVNLTAANRGWDGSPLFSPDGKTIAYRSQATPGYESGLFRIALYDRTSKRVTYLTDARNFDNWVDEIAWTPDSKTLYFQGEFHGRTPLYRIEVGSREVQPVLTDGAIGGWQLLGGAAALVYSRRTTGQPSEIFRVPTDGTSSGTRLTHFNDQLAAEVDIRPAEEMWVQGAGNYKVQVFLVKPHGFQPGKEYPLILNVHGGPQSQWLDAYRGDWQVYPGKGYVVAFANPTGSVGYGQEFTAAISKDWGGRVYRDLMKVTDALEKLPYVDKDRMGSMGWSYGGYMMMWFEGHTHRFKASASMMGVYDLRAMYSATEELWFPEWDLGGQPWNSDLYRKWSPSEYVRNFKTPILVITGERDYRVPYTQSLEFYTDLQKMGVPSRLVVYKKSGHWPSWFEMAFYYNAHLDWFHHYLGGGAAPYDPSDFARNRLFPVPKKESQHSGLKAE